MNTQASRRANADVTLVRRAAILELFRSAPAMTLELLGRLTVHVTTHDELRLEPADPSSTGTANADDLAVLTLRHRGKLAQGIVVDVQLERDTERRYVWPVVSSALRAQLRCPVVLCVVAPHRTTARWASIPIRLGASNVWQPTVLGPAAIPAITDPARALQLPELAVLSAITHGRGMDQERAARIAAAALQASERLELTRCQHYTALVRSSLGEPARKLLHEMDLRARHLSGDAGPHPPP